MVDQIRQAVREAPTTELQIEGESQSILVAAYGRAYRCIGAIRDQAAWPRCDPDHALVLTRSLVSMTAVSLWLVQPETLADRLYRYEQWRRKFAAERLVTLKALVDIGMDVDPAAIEQARSWVEKAKAANIEEIPSDGKLLKELGLTDFYARVHRPGSDAAHFGLGSAVGGFVEPISPDSLEGRKVALEHPRPEEAVEFLAYATTMYGAFLAGSEKVLGHGVTPLARASLDGWMEAYGRDLW